MKWLKEFMQKWLNDEIGDGFKFKLDGEEFVAGDLTLRIFSVLIIIKSFGNLLCYQLVIATGNEKKRLPAYLIAALLKVSY